MSIGEINADGVLLYYSGPIQNTINGTPVAEVLTGTPANDAIDNVGQNQNDTMYGGQGDDIYYVYSNGEKVIENSGEGVDTILSTLNYVLPDNVENLLLFGSRWGIGNALDNILVGNGNGLQLLDGKGGNDVLIASNKADVFVMELGGGHDAIINFKTSVDVARLDGSGFTTYAQVQQHLTQVGSDVALTYNTGEELLFRNHQVSDFSVKNFAFTMDTSRLQMTFDDEFNTLSLYKQGGTWWTENGTNNQVGDHTLTQNGEKEIYVYPGFAGTGTTDLGLNPFSINSGVLSITASRVPLQDQQYLWNYKFQSGMLTTKSTFTQTYGYFEARVKGPVGTGLWPAFWLQSVDPTVAQFEADIFEALGQEPSTVHQVVHTKDPNRPTSTLNQYFLDTPDQFHTYGFKWDANYLVWYVDGQESFRLTTPSDMHTRAFIELNLAVGGFWATNPTNQTPFPSSFQVDYVRAYQLADQAPTAFADSYLANQDKVLTVTAPNGLTQNDTDPDVMDQPWLAPVLVTGPAHGTVVLNIDGSFSYTPTAGYYGADSFTYAASDGLQQSAPVTVNLTVNATPIPAASSNSGAEDTAITGQVSATDPDSATLTYAVVNGPQHGSVVVNANGSYTYTPAANYNGSDSFTFKANDGQTDSPAATVSLTITPVNDAPVAADGSVSGNEDASITGQAPGSDIDSANLTYAKVSGPQHGVLTFNTDGSFSYLANADYSGPDSFTYKVNDGQVDSNVGTITLNVQPVNDAPIANSTTVVYTAIQNANLALKGTGLSISDVDAGSGSMTVTLSVGEGVLNGDQGDSGAVVTGTGTSALTITGAVAQVNAFLGAGGTSTLTYLDNVGSPGDVTALTLTVHDNGNTGSGGDLVGTTTATVNIGSSNHAPVVNTDAVTITSPQSINILPSTLLANDTDADGDLLTVTSVVMGANPHGTVQLVDGVITYTPTAGYSGPDSFKYFVTDGHLVSPVSGTVNVTVLAGGGSQYTTGSGNADVMNFSTRTVAQLVAGQDGNDTITGGFGNDTINAGNGNDVIQGGAGADSMSGGAGADTFIFAKTDFTTPTLDVITDFTGAGNGAVAGDDVIQLSGFSPSATFTQVAVSGSKHTYEVADGAFHGRVVVTYAGAALLQPGDYVFVNSASGPPNAHGDSYSTAEDSTLTVNAASGVLANDSDPAGQPMTAALVSGTTHGVLTFSSNGGFTYTPTANYSGTDSFSYYANDGTALSSATTVTLTVTPVNDAPTSANGSGSTNEDVPLNASLPAFTDIDGDAVTYALGTAASHGVAVVNANGTFTYTPASNYNGSDSFGFTISDGHGGTNSYTYSVSVAAVNDSPVAANGSASGAEDTTITGQASATDVDSASLTYSLATGPQHGSVTVNANGSYSYTPTANYNGADSFTFQASDGNSSSNAGTISLTVTPVNDAPVATDTLKSGAEDTNISGQASASDVDGNPLAYQLVGDVHFGSLTFNPDGTYVYTPDPDFNGSDSFTFEASDGTFTSNLGTVSLTVTPVNDAPVALNGTASTNLNQAKAGQAFATDVDGDPVSFTLVNGPLHGTLIFNPDGTYNYTPNTNYGGADSFTFRANDGQAYGNTATISLTVGSNQAPVATNGSASGNEDTAITGQAAATDADNNPLTYSVATGPQHGTLTLQANGSYSYTPTANYNGSDSFTFKANDGTVDSNVATVALTINPVNDAPTVVGETATSAANGSVSFTTAALLANDTDVDGNALSITGVAMGASPHGTVQLISGVVTYTPTVGYTGPDSFTYTVSDGTVGVNGTVNVTVSTLGSQYTTGTAGNDLYDYSARTITQSVNGQAGNDTITGGAGGDSINGSTGNDVLKGNGGADSLTGGDGTDLMTGGTGADTFVFTATTEFGAVGQEDVITDFSRTDGDRIQLTQIDANSIAGGNQAFSWLGTGAFTNVAGQLHYATSGADLIVSGDLNGDGIADFQFKVQGISNLQASDFFL